MEYDFRNRTRPSYDPQIPISNRPSAAPTAAPPPHPMYANPSLYPRVGQPGSYPINSPSAGPRNPSFHHPHPQPSSSPGIRVALKPEYRITPPPQLSPQIGDIPRSNFIFDFDFERKILAEAEKETQNWSKLGLENLPSKTPETTTSGSTADPSPVVNKYIASGLRREAVTVAVANYGDNPTKVKEFVDGYSLLLEMGFSPNSVVDALLMYDNDTTKALALCLNNSSQ